MHPYIHLQYPRYPKYPSTDEEWVEMWWIYLYMLSHSVVSFCDPMDCGFSVHGDSPGKNTGAGCHALLQVIFPTQGLNPVLLHCRQILYHLSHQGSPDISISISIYLSIYLSLSIYTHNGILLSHKKLNLAIFANMVGPRSYYTKWNKSEKDRYCIISLIYGI